MNFSTLKEHPVLQQFLSFPMHVNLEEVPLATSTVLFVARNHPQKWKTEKRKQ